MAATTELRVTVEKKLADEASLLYEAEGMTLSEAIHEFLVRTVAGHAVPHELIPNQETIDAMMAARRGEVVRVGSVDELFASLNSDH